jgi:hypothetical protein
MKPLTSLYGYMPDPAANFGNVVFRLLEAAGAALERMDDAERMYLATLLATKVANEDMPQDWRDNMNALRTLVLSWNRD